MIPEIRPSRYLQVAVLGLVCLSFLNMLYCTMAYEFGWGPTTILSGPEDRFADLIKLSLSFRSVTNGADQTDSFRSWRPIYQGYYEHPVYGGIDALATGQLTHFHHPPFSTLILQLCGLFIVRTGSPSLALFLFFCIYLFEVWSICWIGIPAQKRNPALSFTIWFFCLASYPALVIFGRGNYVNAGMTTIPVIIFLVALFARKQASAAALLALAVAVNVHPNAIIFLIALPLVLGTRKAIRPLLQFAGFAGAIFVGAYIAAHRLYPDYTITTFRKGLAIYSKVYIAGGAGIRGGSSLFGLIRALNRGFHLGVSFPVEMRIFYILAALVLAITAVAYWKASTRGNTSERLRNSRTQNSMKRSETAETNPWPLPLAPFLLVGLYCILSPIFADYHLLVFLAPLILAYLHGQESQNRSRLLLAVVLVSVFMLSPKNYVFLQILLNPAVLCVTILWIGMVMLKSTKQQLDTTAAFQAADGR